MGAGERPGACEGECSGDLGDMHWEKVCVAVPWCALQNNIWAQDPIRHTSSRNIFSAIEVSEKGQRQFTCVHLRPGALNKTVKHDASYRVYSRNASSVHRTSSSSAWTTNDRCVHEEATRKWCHYG